MKLNRITDVPGMNFFFQVDNLFLAGQPSEESLESLKDYNFKSVINLRSQGEGDFSFEEKFFKENDIDYSHFPLLDEKGLSRKSIDKLNDLIEGDDNHLIHCASANRVGAWLITYLVENKNINFDEAVDIAMQSGLTNPQLISLAQMAIDQGKK